MSYLAYLRSMRLPRTISIPLRSAGSQHRSYIQQTSARATRQSLARPSICSHQTRCKTDDATTNPLTDSARSSESDAISKSESEEIAARKAQEPAYEMTFTCRKCITRSTHRITKQAYHFGTTLITCPSCKSRHLISDNLKIFSDKRMTLEDILREKGEFLKKGRLGEDGDIEFYDDSKPAT